MSESSRRDSLWGLAAYALQYGSALLVVPALLTSLTSEELGLWFIYLTLVTATAMLDMGFSPAISRGFSYVLAGSKAIERRGFSVAQVGAGIDLDLANVVVVSAKRIYQLLSILALILLGSFGTRYLFAVAPPSLSHSNVELSWAILVSGITLGLALKGYAALLQGQALFRVTYKATIAANAAFLVVTLISVATHGGLVGLSLGFFAQSVSMGLVNCVSFSRGPYGRSNGRSATRASRSVISALWHNAWRQGVGSVGAFLIVRGNVLLISAYVGLASGAAYALSLQVFSSLMSIASVPLVVRLPRISGMRASQDGHGVVALARQGFWSGLIIYAVCSIGAIVVAIWAPKSLALSHAIVPPPLFATMSVMLFLELCHVLSAIYIATGNEVPYVWPSVMSGLAVVTISWLGLSGLGFGISMVIVTQFSVQLAYNNWKWPLEMRRDWRRLSSIGDAVA
jgi:O-antigen/teichoic acid export membrane protein